MKNIFALLVLLFISSCNQPKTEILEDNDQILSSNSNLIVTPIDSELKCRMCPGYIIVKSGEKIDTIESGIWGKPGKYIHFQQENEHYIAFPGGYYSGGISETSIRIISLNDGNYLEKVFDTLVSDSFQSEMEVRRISFDFLPPDTLSFLTYSELYNAKDESPVREDSISRHVKIKFK